MVERGRWMKPKVQYIDRKLHYVTTMIYKMSSIVFKCAYYNEVRRKYIKRYYNRHPSMYKFIPGINEHKKEETHFAS